MSLTDPPHNPFSTASTHCGHEPGRNPAAQQDRGVLSFGWQHRHRSPYRPKSVPMRKSLLFIPGPVAVSEPVLAAMAKPLINHRGPEYARLLHSIAER